MYIWRYFLDFGQILPIKNLTKHFDFSSLHKLFLSIANQIKGWGRQREKRGEKRREEKRRFQVLQQGWCYICSLPSFPMVSCMLLSHGSQAVQTSNIYTGFENVVCSCNFVICTVKYTHLCIRHGVQTSNPLYRSIEIMGWLWDTEEEWSYKVHSTIRPGTCKKELGNYKKFKWELSGSFNHKTMNMQKRIRELQKI